MTLFGWDASHYDGYLDRDVLLEAKGEGITFFHHKIAEGLSNTERGPSGDYDDTALAAARDVGIEFIGGYLVPRSLDSAAQVDFWIRTTDQGEPWWREFPTWYWVGDLELWSYDKVSAGKGIDTAKRLRDKTGCQTVLYASHGQYGDQLSTWDGPLINADYVSVGDKSSLAFKDLYPGDGWTPLHTGGWRGGWTPYSGKTPAFLQYTSQATVAGRTTCDVNAFRGTLEQLRALLSGGQDVALDTMHEMSDGYERSTEQLIVDVWEACFGKRWVDNFPDSLAARLGKLEEKVTAGGVDLDALADRLVARLRPEVRDAVADLGEKGAQGVRSEQ